jgi:23S rRNA (cytosine1962-C5)-methyltransferase
MASVILKNCDHGFLKYKHPWIFSGAIVRIDGSPGLGETVEVRTEDGTMCGRGAFSPYSQIMVRMWTSNAEEEVSKAFFRSRLMRAVASRHLGRFPLKGNSARLVYSESDGLPGIIVDRYGDFLVCQYLTAGAEYWKDTIVALLNELVPNSGIFERSDVDVRKREGLPEHTGILAGHEPPEFIKIVEGPHCFLVDVRRGHKTGFYLDQRENRLRVGGYMEGADVLDCFSYTGGFSVVALTSGAARVVSVDSSAPALRLATRNITLNGMDESKSEIVEAKVPDLLRRYRDSGRRFDVIILDPPKFVYSYSQLKQAGRAYKDINMMALKLLSPDGLLVTFSCSQLMTSELFQKVLSQAALDARRDVQILHRLHQAPDHPTALNFPEAGYLKGFVCRVS